MWRPLHWLTPLVALALLGVLVFTSLGANELVVLDVHVAVVSVANIISATFGILALFAFSRSGQVRDLGLGLAFLGFVALYAWHGIYTGSQHPFQWLIYGPASRVVFAAGLFVMLSSKEITGRRRLPVGLAVLLGWLGLGIVAGLLGPRIGAWALQQPMATLSAVRLVVEASALVLIAVVWLRVARLAWANTPLILGLGIITVQSVYFLLGSAWNVTWWAAHALGAMGTASLAVGVLVVARVTESELARRQLLNEARVRQDFINHASHAIRTPLTTLSIGIHSVKASYPDAKRSVDKMERAVGRLQQIADQMAQVAGHRVSRPPLLQRTQLGAFVDAVLQRYRSAHPDHVVTLEALQLEASIDAEWLEAVLVHLLDNARLYASGPVEVTMRRERRRIQIRVRDHGPGVPEDQWEAIFLPFSGYAEERPSGFTLAACRLRIAAMAGTLEVQAVRGPGAMFVISLPLPRPSRSGHRIRAALARTGK